MNSRNILSERVFWISFASFLLFEIVFTFTYFPNKGDIFTLNFSSIQLLDEARRFGLLELFKKLLFHRLDKGTSLILIEIPFLALGLDSILVNRLLVLFFVSASFICTYGGFRFRVGPWTSALGAVASLSCSLVFKNINQYETFLPALGFIPAIYFFGKRLELGIGSKRLNSAFLVLAMFFIISSRPVEGFLLAVATVAFIPNVLRSRTVWVGFLVGSLWWLLDFNTMKGYWLASRALDLRLQNELTAKALLSPATSLFIFLFFTLIFSVRKVELAREVKVALLAVLLNAAFMVFAYLMENDHLVIAVFILNLGLLHAILTSEKIQKIGLRTGLIALLALAYFADQSYAIFNSMPLALAQPVSRSHPDLVSGWKKMEIVFPVEKKSKVGLVFHYWDEPRFSVRPAWCLLQTFAYQANFPVEFTFPYDYVAEIQGVGRGELCAQGLTHLLLIEGFGPRMDDSRPDPNESKVYMFESHPIALELIEHQQALTEFHVGVDKAGLIQEMNFRLLKLPCNEP